jgi:hypothetical protein
MAIKFGQFLARSGTGTQDITLPFDPVAVHIWSNTQIGSQPLTDGYWYFHDGVLTSALQVARGSSDEDGAATSDTHHHYIEGKVISARNNLGTLEMEASGALGSNKFTLTWTTNSFTNAIYNYMAIGGPGVSAELLSRDKGTGSTGADETYTGLSIGTPDFVMVFPAFADASSPPTSQSLDNGATFPSLGWMNSTTQGCAGVCVEDGQATTDTWRYQRMDRCLQHLNSGNGTIRYMAHVVSFGSNQFTINWDAVDALSNIKLYFLCVKGIFAHCFNFTQKTTGTGTQTLTGFPIEPQAVMLMTTYLATQGTGATPINTATQANARFMLGASDASVQICATVGSSDGQANTVNARHQSDARAIVVLLEAEPGSSSTILASAVVDSFTSDGLVLDWDVNDSVGREILGIAFSDDPSLIPPVTSSLLNPQLSDVLNSRLN